jgi:alkylation response protein AidB-like acyl-CoA dehydrogenase
VSGGLWGGRPSGPALTGAFRAEVRDWLAAHVPTEPLPSLEGAEGFARHREWERELAAARLSVVSWPAAYGGRDATLAEWLVFEEEYYAAGAPTRVGQNGLSLRSPGRFLAAAARLAELWRRAGDPDDTALGDRVADAWIGARAYQLHTQATAERLAAGGTLGAEASLGKVFWSELDVALHETALDLLGPHPEVRDGPDGRWLEDYLFALAGPIYAGTNEIQRTLIAERVLGLPR